ERVSTVPYGTCWLLRKGLFNQGSFEPNPARAVVRSFLFICTQQQGPTQIFFRTFQDCNFSESLRQCFGVTSPPLWVKVVA
ncbi:MAG: hypothetical protein ACREQO_21070, partial [Candidatus Binatia bacterium]